jgi:phthiodiolone/phenolphthiodiolone dimycocerosates ketoreductase
VGEHSSLVADSGSRGRAGAVENGQSALKIGGLLSPMGSIELCRTVLHAYEAMGLDSVWLPDHLMGSADPRLWPEIPASSVIPDPDGWFDPFCVAGALTGSTRLPMGTCVTDGLRRRGADLARSALTLHQEGAGRFTLGVGAGEAESILPFGYSFDRPVGCLEQALIEIRSLFDTGRMPEGLGRTGLIPPDPDDRPALWVAAHGPRALKLAGRYGDGWLPTTPYPDVYAEQLETVDAAASQVGRPAPTRGLAVCTVFGPDRDEVAKATEAVPLSKVIMLFQSAHLWQKYGLDHPAGADVQAWRDTIPHALDPDLVRAALTSVPTEMLEECVFIGNAEDVADRLRPFVDVGLEHVVICDITGLVYPPDVAGAHLAELGRLRSIFQPADAVRPTREERR